MIIDIHTHQIPVRKGTALISLSLEKPEIIEDHYYSAGIHPWSVNGNMGPELDQLAELLLLPSVLAVGEAGMDSLVAGNTDWQENVLLAQIEMSESLNKPMILHVVRGIDKVISLRKRVLPRCGWLIHGFRGNGVEAARLRKLGFSLSFGTLHNRSALLETPLSEMFLETDTEVDIVKLYNYVSLLKKTPPATLIGEVSNNIKRFLDTSFVR